MCFALVAEPVRPLSCSQGRLMSRGRSTSAWWPEWADLCVLDTTKASHCIPVMNTGGPAGGTAVARIGPLETGGLAGMDWA